MYDPLRDLQAQLDQTRKLTDLSGINDFVKRLTEQTAPAFGSIGLPSGLLGASAAISSSLFSPTLTGTSLLPDSALRLESHDDEVAHLRKKIRKQSAEIQAGALESEEMARQIAALETNIRDLQEKERLGHVMNAVNGKARELLLSDSAFRDQFLGTSTAEAFVLSVDIRRSTELMLKARSAEAFAAFLQGLSRELMEVIVSHYGVFDKFTGDGILAFFPDFYSGPNAAGWALCAARECHRVFDQLYRASRSSFVSVLKEVGLGIGIDFGTVHLVRVAGGLTVVGVPVVYACRLSGAPAGVTLLNQASFDRVKAYSGATYELVESEIEVKHEGRMVAYRAAIPEGAASPAAPAWVTAAQAFPDASIDSSK
jgi:class 3 adenylate cyclase